MAMEKLKPVFIKLANTPHHPGWGGRRRVFTSVHIEKPSLYLEGTAHTLCGRHFKSGTFFEPFKWSDSWDICRTCNQVAKARGLFPLARVV